MKLSKLLLVGFASMALAACDMPWSKKDKGGDTPEYDLNPDISGGSEEEKKAILETLNNKPICMKNGTSSSEIFYDSHPNLMEDEGDNVKLTTKQVVSGKTVNITWELDESQEYFSKWLKPATDQNHWFIEIDYKGYDYGKTHGDGSLSWKISKMECGEAKTTGNVVSYSATVKNEQYYHDNVTIDDCYKIVEGEYTKTDSAGVAHKFPSRFDLVDYDKEDAKGNLSPYYKTNNPEAKEKQYYYVNVTGKVIFLAPDGNFGLIADGDNVLEIYAGSGTALKTSNYPNLAVGNVVTVVGNLGQFCGNVQLGFITKVLQGDPAAITAPTNPLTFREMTEAKIGELTAPGYQSHTQAIKVDGVHMEGSLRSVTGTLVANSIEWCDGDADDAKSWKSTDADGIKKTKRFKFRMAVGTKEYTIAFDYHIVRNSNSMLFETLQGKLKSGAAFTVKGFSRYFGNNSTPFDQEVDGKGVWELLPFEDAHVA